MLIFLFAACSEYDLSDKENQPGELDSEGNVVDDSAVEEPAKEECNGVDDNGDGNIDEGFNDTDEDGIADCQDDTCEVGLEAAGSVTVLDECKAFDAGQVADPWDFNLKWEYRSNGMSVVLPVVGNLSDDNGDGVIDSLDTPDIAFTGYGSGEVHVVSGDTGTLVCKATGFSSDGGVIIADVDGDGVNDIVGPGNNGKVKALNNDCSLKWQSAQTYGFMYPVTTAADLDGDGDVEVVADVAVVNGTDGSNVAALAPANSMWRTPIVADIDLDGSQEIILGSTVYRANGAASWSVQGASGSSCFGTVQDTDGDAEAEIGFSCGQRFIMYDHDGTKKWEKALAVANPGPPCAGDIDGDGLVEIIAPNGNQIAAFENDGTPKWTTRMQDSSGAAGCSVFDMNGDNTYEVIFADEIALRVYDGATGSVLYENRNHGSVTYFEYATVADVDNDGSAEIMVVNSSGALGGLTVFGHAGAGWPSAGPTWGIHDYAATNQNPDGSIPSNPTPSWQSYNIFRGRPYADIPGSPDLVGAITDTCVSSCGERMGVVYVAYQVQNQGGADSSATSVSLYVVNGGVETLFETQVVPVATSGEAQAGGSFAVPLASTGDGGFVLRIDDDGTGTGLVSECDEDNNVHVYPESFCGR